MGGFYGPNKFFKAYHRFINNAFSSYGSYIAHKPFLPLCLGIILLGGFCFGLFKYSKETDLEELWVEHGSRVVDERVFFNSRFGGIPRQEVVAIVSKDNPDKQLSLAQAFDALSYSVGPLFDSLTWEYTYPDGRRKANLTQRDFCYSPLVPTLLKPGSNPVKDGNWLSYGFQLLSTCSLQNTMASQVPPVTDWTPLPDGWGIDRFPCTKLNPMDCFREGQDFDYPLALQQLETVQPAISTGTFTLVDITLQFQLVSNSCIDALTSNISSTFDAAGVPASVYASQVPTLVAGVVAQAKSFFSWGYRWRRSYKGLSDAQIIDHLNSAIKNAQAWDPSATNPEVTACITQNQPCCLTWFGLHIPILSAFGSITKDPTSDNVTKIGGIRWGQDNYNENQALWTDYISEKLQANFTPKQYKNMHRGWENQMTNRLLPLRNRQNNLYSDKQEYSDFQLEFLTWRAIQDIISDSAKTPVWQIILSVILTSAYAYFAFVNFKDAVHSHTWLVLTGMTVVTLAILSGFGFTSLVGIKSSPLAGGVVPFLALAIGVDDVFVLSNILRNYLSDPRLQEMGKGSLIPEREMRLALALVGPSVILTTFSVLAAFFISSLNPMPISQWFCWQMGITASIHTIGLLTIFMPIMAIDARRCKAGINDPNLWLVKGFRSKGAVAGRAAAVKDESVDNMKDADLEDFDELDPSLQENTGSTRISRLVAKYFAPLFESNTFKIIVVLVSLGLLASMTYLGFHKVQHGLKLSDVTLTGSYENTFSRLTEERFPNYDVYIVTGDLDYPNRQAQMVEIFDNLVLTKWSPPQPRIIESSWLGNLFLYSNSTVNSPTPIPAQNFYSLMHPWTSTSLGIFSLQDLYCVDNYTRVQISCFESTNPNLVIAASRSAMFAQDLGANTEPNLEMIKGTRKIVDGLNKKYGEQVAYMYGYPFLFYEQYLHSYHDLYLVVGFALVGVFISILVFQQSIVISLLICVLLLITDLEVYGFIYIIGAKLNALSLVNLGIVIGMSAEFTYLARSFLVVEGTRNQRVGKALEWTFEPLLHGFGVQFFATFPLIFVKYPAFRLYYFAMFTIMGIFAFLNGFFLLPAILSWIGPDTLHHIQEASAAAAFQRQVAKGIIDANGKHDDELEAPVHSDASIGEDQPAANDINGID